MKLVFATRNQGKLRELRQLLGEPDGLELLSLDQLPDAPEIEETGATFAENAALKAQGIMAATGLPCLADDSGLEVDALGGAPGVRSARYAGPGASDADRIELLLQHLAGVPQEQRSARFRCAVAFCDAGAKQPIIREGRCEGRILQAPQGNGGFGYDPVFFVESLGQTFAQIPAQQKNEISHRGRAMQQMLPLLQTWIGQQAQAGG